MVAGVVALIGGVGGGIAAAVVTPSHTGSSPGVSSGANSPIGTGYLAFQSNGVAFIEWIDKSGSLSGTAQYADIVTNTDGSESLSHGTDTVSGQTNGSSLSITIDGTASQVGQWSGGSFTINVPQADGSLDSVTFNPGSARGYNQAIAKLRRQVSSFNAQLAQQQAAAQQRQQEQQAIDTAAQTAASDISDLNQTDFSGDLGNLSGDAGNIQGLLEDAEGNMQDVSVDATETLVGICTAVNGVALNAQEAGQQLSAQVAPQVEQLSNDMAGTKQFMQTAQKDVAAYQSAQAKLPTYTPSPPVGDLNSAINTAQAAINAAASQANQYIDQANSYVAEAYQLASQVNQQYSCGSSLTEPAAVQPFQT